MIEKIVLALFPSVRAALIEEQTLSQVKQFAADSIDKALLDIDNLQHDRHLCVSISRILVKTVQQIYEKDLNIKDVAARSQYQILTERMVDLVSFCDNCELDIFKYDLKFAQRKGYSMVAAAVKGQLKELKQMYNEIHL